MAPTVAESLEWCRRRAGEGAIDHLLRIAPAPANEAWGESEEGAIYSGWPDIARASIVELVGFAESEMASDPESALDRTCDECYASTHPYLESCVGCGRYLGVAVGRLAHADTPKEVLFAEVRKSLEFERVVHDGPDELVRRIAMSIGGGLDGLDPAQFNEVQRLVARRVSEEEAARYPTASRLSLFTRLDFRYVGGLPAYPGEVDVRVQPDPDVLRVLGRGAIMAAIPYYAILGVWPFGEDTAVSRTQLGLISSSLLILPNPTFKGGALGIMAVIGGRTVSFAIGNREGWLTKKAPFEFYSGLSISMSGAISSGVTAREAEVGADALAAELGLRIPAET